MAAALGFPAAKPRNNKQHMPEYEVEITLSAADIKVTAVWNNGNYKVTLTDTSDIPEDIKSTTLDNVLPYQFAALSALFAAGDDWPDEQTELCKSLYAIAEPLLVNVPQNLRPIP